MNTKSNYITVVTKTKDENPKLYNTVTFLQTISNPLIMQILNNLAKKPCSYSELFQAQDGKKGAFAFYLRKAKKQNLLVLDRLRGTYKITFRGLKAVELIRSVSKIANLNISKISDAETNLFVSLEQNKSWLEPVIVREIRSAINSLTSSEFGQS